jgi:hypothetical protein
VQLIEEIMKRYAGSPASQGAIKEAEKKIGYQFPPLLRHIYEKVANGGIGPGYKILGVRGGLTSDEGDTISELYAVLSGENNEDPSWLWPEGIVPFCHWGCAIYSCFDATQKNFPVVWFDPNIRESGEPMEQQFIPHRESLESWVQGWLKGDDLWAETYGT